MGIFEGLVGGFGKAYGTHQKEAAAKTARQAELEQSILGQLLGSDNPQVQMRAIQSMIQGVSGKPKKKGGLAGWLGETEPSEAFTGMFDYLRDLDKPKPRGPDTVTNTMEEGVPTQTITAAPEGTPTTLFKSPEQRRLEAGQTERQNIMGELEGAGASKEAQIAGAYGVDTTKAAGPGMKTIELADGVYNWDPTTGQLGEKLGEAKGATSRSALQRVTTDQGVFAWDPQTGQIVTRLGGAPERDEVPRDEPSYLNAQATLDQINAALAAKYPKLALEMGERAPQFQAIQQEREALAQQYRGQSFADVQKDAATRRGEAPIGMPPSANMGIQGQGEDVDHQRATEIWTAGQSGKIPSPEDQAFIRQYIQMYRDQLEP